MPPRKRTTGRGTAAISSERDQPFFDFSGFDFNQHSVQPRISSKSIGFLPEDELPWLSDGFAEDQGDKNGGIVRGGSAARPRTFSCSVKRQCWEKAEKVKGRDPDRWRRDPLGNIIFRKLVGCPGCLCYDYDHIVPYSKIMPNETSESYATFCNQTDKAIKGGKSTLENCQILQATVNRSKGSKTGLSQSDLMQKSTYCKVSGRDLDLLELSAYGNVRRAQDSFGCSIQ